MQLDSQQVKTLDCESSGMGANEGNIKFPDDRPTVNFNSIIDLTDEQFLPAVPGKRKNSGLNVLRAN